MREMLMGFDEKVAELWWHLMEIEMKLCETLEVKTVVETLCSAQF